MPGRLSNPFSLNLNGLLEAYCEQQGRGLRLFNARLGFDRKQDAPPKKFFKPLGGVGPTAGTFMTHAEFDTALDQYYRLMGWYQQGLAPAT